MKNFLPTPPWPLGPKRPEFYLCTCEKCGFKQMYETGNFEVIVCDGSEEDTSILHVESVPRECPKCGATMKKQKMPNPLKY